MRITDVANYVRSKPDQVSLLLWTTGINPQCNQESLCCGPMPQNLERLSASVSTILAALECPVCLDTIPPPCIQCLNGHLICASCSSRSERCPVCREKYSPGRSLIAENIFTSITQAFQLSEDESKLREKLFGPACKRAKRMNGNSERKPSKTHTHTFLARIMGNKSSSVDNLSSKNIHKENGILKMKSLSLSSSEIFHDDGKQMSIPRSLATASNNDLPSPQQITYQRRPRSCNVSTERLTQNHDDDFQISIPVRVEHVTYHCPYGQNCKIKLNPLQIQKHVSESHKVPVINFGTALAEITLPPKSPVENASLQLHEGTYTFWLRLICASNGDLFTSAMIQGSKSDSEQFVLEVSLTNLSDSKIHRKELIARNEIFDMENFSWMVSINIPLQYYKHVMNILFSDDSRIKARHILCSRES